MKTTWIECSISGITKDLHIGFSPTKNSCPSPAPIGSSAGNQRNYNTSPMKSNLRNWRALWNDRVHYDLCRQLLTYNDRVHYDLCRQLLTYNCESGQRGNAHDGPERIDTEHGGERDGKREVEVDWELEHTLTVDWDKVDDFTDRCLFAGWCWQT